MPSFRRRRNPFVMLVPVLLIVGLGIALYVTLIAKPTSTERRSKASYDEVCNVKSCIQATDCGSEGVWSCAAGKCRATACMDDSSCGCLETNIIPLPGSGDVQTYSEFFNPKANTFTTSMWRGDIGYMKTIPVGTGANWTNNGTWTTVGPLDTRAPGSGDMQAQDEVIVGDNVLQSIWRGSTGYLRLLPIAADGTVNWSVAFGNAISLSPLPGSGTFQALDATAYTKTDGSRVLIQSFWRNNTSYYRVVPIDTANTVLWNDASATWHGPIDISAIPGSGDIQAQTTTLMPDNTVRKTVWRGNLAYRRTASLGADGLPNWDAATAPWTGPFAIVSDTVPTATATPVVLRGDINGDRTVDVIDYAILYSNWGRPSEEYGALLDTRANIDNVGVVDTLDYSIWYEDFGKSY